MLTDTTFLSASINAEPDTTFLYESLKTRAERIVADGTEIRPRLREAIANAAEQSQQNGQGIVGVVQAVLDGAQEGLQKSMSPDPNDVLRQVVDGLGDGLSQTALAARLAVEEAGSVGRQFAQEDLMRLRDDMMAINTLFTEAVFRTLRNAGNMTVNEVNSLTTHACNVRDRVSPVVGSVLEAVSRDPILLGTESVQAGVNMSRHAAGALFQAVGNMLERAGTQLRQPGCKN
jgi:hypothetical protein